jgi:hypothetical protein
LEEQVSQVQDSARNHTHVLPGGYEVMVGRSVDDVEKLRNVWQMMQWHPNADIDFYLTILRVRSEIVRPHVIYISKQGSPEAILVGRIERQSIHFKVGYWTFGRMHTVVLRIIHGGVMGNLCTTTAGVFMNQLLKALTQGESDAVLFHYLPEDSEFCSLIKTLPQFFCKDYQPENTKNWWVQLPASKDEFLNRMSSKHRYWIRRKERLLEKAYQGEVLFKWFRGKNELESLFRDAESVAKKTYQRGLGVGFIDDQENRKRYSLSAEKDWLRAYILYLKGEPVAFWIGTLYARTFYLDSTGFDPTLAEHELGKLLFVKMIDNLCADGVSRVDFGYGDAFYKRQFGEGHMPVTSIYVFAKTAKGISINMVRTIVSFINNTIQHVAKSTGFESRIKKYWRKKIQVS